MGNSSIWGRPFWVFFHALSICISDAKYILIKSQLMIYFRSLCALLPCPDCASHATEFLKKWPVPPTLIDYQKFLCMFHNSVNARTFKPNFPFEKLIIYKHAPLYHLFRCFEHAYLINSYNPAMITYNMSKKNCMHEFSQWCHKNNIFKN